MPDWTPIEKDFPEEYDEDYSLEVAGRWGRETWEFRMVGDDAYLRVTGYELVLELPDLKTFGGLFPDPEIWRGTTDAIVAKWPQIYIAESRSADRGPLGIENVTGGSYAPCWYDVDNERWAAFEETTLDGADEWFDAPDDCGEHVFLYLRRTSR